MIARHRLPIISILLLTLAAALAGGLSLSQEQDAQDDAPAVAILEFSTYDCKWLRYKNWNALVARKLAIEDHSLFPFRHLVSENRPKLADLEAADSLAEQLAQYGDIDESAVVYDEERLGGDCDTEKLSGDYADLFCVPGTSEMPDGQVSLVLYHPESFEIVALTTAIDNTVGGATYAGCWRPPTAEPTPVVEAASEGCGPYAPGQWVTAEEYEASGLNLPVSTENTQFPILHYTCMAPESAPSYLQAHPLIQPEPTPTPTPTPKPRRSEPDAAADDDDESGDDDNDEEDTEEETEVNN